MKGYGIVSQTNYQYTTGAEDQAAQGINDAAHAAGAALRDATAQFREAASDIGARVGRRADDAVDHLADRVQEQPVTSLLIAGGIGLVAGLLLARR